MVSLEDFKKSLGSLAEKLSDEEIERLCCISDRFADAVFDDWKKNLNHAKEGPGMNKITHENNN